MTRASQLLSSSGATDPFRVKDPSPPGVGCNALFDPRKWPSAFMFLVALLVARKRMIPSTAIGSVAGSKSVPALARGC